MWSRDVTYGARGGMIARSLGVFLLGAAMSLGLLAVPAHAGERPQAPEVRVYHGKITTPRNPAATREPAENPVAYAATAGNENGRVVVRGRVALSAPCDPLDPRDGAAHDAADVTTPREHFGGDPAEAPFPGLAPTADQNGLLPYFSGAVPGLPAEGGGSPRHAAREAGWWPPVLPIPANSGFT
ncbi:hypothetical protein ACFVUW_20910 [Streptomyces xiamenensis]|uniref:hypothetical protein n=1 Tax=Streptomyces xiamenensis TaxID=408015 RepID=UPI0036E93077